MQKAPNIYHQIAAILLETARPNCVEKARTLMPSSTLSFRSLDLTPAEITHIANCLKTADQESPLIRSISFSYNHTMGDAGAIALAAMLPQSLTEIGLVGCGIGDAGGKALLKWMQKSPKLKMACIENNHFSADLIKQLQELSAQRPHMLLVV
ncbi:MAG: hypothetical protein AB8H47_31205 [Bacteroidia bacterium]